MPRVPFAKNTLDPRRSNSFLDTCAFDPKYSPEHETAQAIRVLGDKGEVRLLLTHSNLKEVDHPNTPEDVKKQALDMIFTYDTPLNQGEIVRKEKIHVCLTGNGKPEKYAADAAHVFDAGKYGGGYFITTDARILNKRGELHDLSSATIVLPSEWLRIFKETARLQTSVDQL